MLFVLIPDHIRNVFLYFDLYGHGKLDFNPPMAKGEGGCHPQQVFPTFSEMGRAFLQTQLLPVGSSLGHLSIKNFFS